MRHSALPEDLNLNTGAFSRVFRNTTNSYKYLFFLALLDRIKQDASQSQATRVIPIVELIAGALRFGWYPHRFFNLSFGAQDKIGDALDKLNFTAEERAIGQPATSARLLSSIQNQFAAIGGLTFARYVPFRLLAVFFQNELRGIKDAQKDKKIFSLALDYFDSPHTPLYRVTDDILSIEIHPLWLDYLLTNFSVVRGWALFEWATFLQARNPNTPAILPKIEPPPRRSSLMKQNHFWNQILEAKPLSCIYSGVRLWPGKFQVDHFIPWSFICHDELWNLIPATPSANAEKGRSLPNDKNVADFIAQQQRALKLSHDLMKPTEWKRTVSSYAEGLNLPYESLLYEPELERAYRNRLTTLSSLASQLGFNILDSRSYKERNE